MITGSKGAGKSTVFNLIRQENPFPAVFSFALRGKDGYPNQIILTREESDEKVIIAQREQNRIKAICDVLDQTASTMLERLCYEPSEWVGIDEIGFIEGESLIYGQMLHQIFDRKRVIAVLRKQELPFLDRFKERQDCFLIDIDEWEEWLLF